MKSALGMLGRGRKALFRRARVFFYSFGANVECCLCGWVGLRFLPAGQANTPNRLCPGCGSLQRYRIAMLYLQQQESNRLQNGMICEIAPKPCFRRWVRKCGGLRYVGIDLDSREADVLSDLTRLGIKDGSLDVVICLHVLEHIPDDQKAIAEICRVLRPGGFAIIMVPLRGLMTIEDPTLPRSERERVFGQADHVRFYGSDIADRLRQPGFNVDVFDTLALFPSDIVHRRGLSGDDRFFFKVSHQE